MQVNDEQWLSVADSFGAAAMGSGSWIDALAGLATATGSRGGQVVGFGSDRSVHFNWASGLGADWAEQFIAMGGGDPAVNPVVRAGARVSPLTVLSTAQFLTAKERRSDPFVVEHMYRHDIPHGCLTPLVREDGMLIGLAMLRSGREGEVTAHQRRVFATIAPHVRAAVLTQLALENQGALLVAGAMEALSLAVFVCGRNGRVQAMSPAAERLVEGHGPLRLKSGSLHASDPVRSRELAAAIDIAAAGLQRPGAPLSRTVVAESDAGPPLSLKVIPLPRREYAFGFEPRVLVVAKGASGEGSDVASLLRVAYGLTSAEADVAQRLAEGQSPNGIADARCATLATVRVQIRAVYMKLDVHSLNELIALLHRFL